MPFELVLFARLDFLRLVWFDDPVTDQRNEGGESRPGGGGRGFAIARLSGPPSLRPGDHAGQGSCIEATRDGGYLPGSQKPCLPRSEASAASPELLERADAFLAEHGQDAAMCRAVIEGRDVAEKAMRARKLPA